MEIPLRNKMAQNAFVIGNKKHQLSTLMRHPRLSEAKLKFEHCRQFIWRKKMRERERDQSLFSLREIEFASPGSESDELV